MTKKFKLNVPVFTDAYITVVFTDNFGAYIKRNIKEHYDEEDLDYAGQYFLTEDNREFIVFDISQFKEEDTIVHEAFHACFNALTTKGIPLNAENEETYAYTLEYIFSKINRHWKKIKEKLNGDTSKDKSGEVLQNVPGIIKPVAKA